MAPDHSSQPPPATRPQLSLSSNASSSASLFAGEFPQMPVSPTTPDQGPFAGNSIPRFASRVNLQGSWLDLESDDEDPSSRRTTTLVRSRRKNSGASAKDSSSRNPLANFRELTHRGSVHIRRLTGKVVR
ncbi:hypothetical protein H4R20_007033 [Coemansia guatemalensis]|uniref:Uncharacterized protein n=1 Tax=Coemansia guatemalensis TaxID=2761395 RepID=A0A9W8HTL0_9FUNG|nr:hypothetical protein H4R20_007033 [Coemansia guatemalensis]